MEMNRELDSKKSTETINKKGDTCSTSEKLYPKLNNMREDAPVGHSEPPKILQHHGSEKNKSTPATSSKPSKTIIHSGKEENRRQNETSTSSKSSGRSEEQKISKFSVQRNGTSPVVTPNNGQAVRTTIENSHRTSNDNHKRHASTNSSEPSRKRHDDKGRTHRDDVPSCSIRRRSRSNNRRDERNNLKLPKKYSERNETDEERRTRIAESCRYSRPYVPEYIRRMERENRRRDRRTPPSRRSRERDRRRRISERDQRRSRDRRENSRLKSKREEERRQRQRKDDQKTKSYSENTRGSDRKRRFEGSSRLSGYKIPKQIVLDKEQARQRDVKIEEDEPNNTEVTQNVPENPSPPRVSLYTQRVNQIFPKKTASSPSVNQKDVQQKISEKVAKRSVVGQCSNEASSSSTVQEVQEIITNITDCTQKLTLTQDDGKPLPDQTNMVHDEAMNTETKTPTPFEQVAPPAIVTIVQVTKFVGPVKCELSSNANLIQQIYLKKVADQNDQQTSTTISTSSQLEGSPVKTSISSKKFSSTSELSTNQEVPKEEVKKTLSQSLPKTSNSTSSPKLENQKVSNQKVPGETSSSSKLQNKKEIPQKVSENTASSSPTVSSKNVSSVPLKLEKQKVCNQKVLEETLSSSKLQNNEEISQHVSKKTASSSPPTVESVSSATPKLEKQKVCNQRVVDEIPSSSKLEIKQEIPQRVFENTASSSPPTVPSKNVSSVPLKLEKQKEAHQQCSNKTVTISPPKVVNQEVVPHGVPAQNASSCFQKLENKKNTQQSVYGAASSSLEKRQEQKDVHQGVSKIVIPPVSHPQLENQKVDIDVVGTSTISPKVPKQEDSQQLDSQAVSHPNGGEPKLNKLIIFKESRKIERFENSPRLPQRETQFQAQTMHLSNNIPSTSKMQNNEEQKMVMATRTFLIPTPQAEELPNPPAHPRKSAKNGRQLVNTDFIRTSHVARISSAPIIEHRHIEVPNASNNSNQFRHMPLSFPPVHRPATSSLLPVVFPPNFGIVNTPRVTARTVNNQQLPLPCSAPPNSRNAYEVKVARSARTAPTKMPKTRTTRTKKKVSKTAVDNQLQNNNISSSSSSNFTLPFVVNQPRETAIRHFTPTILILNGEPYGESSGTSSQHPVERSHSTLPQVSQAQHQLRTLFFSAFPRNTIPFVNGTNNIPTVSGRPSSSYLPSSARVSTSTTNVHSTVVSDVLGNQPILHPPPTNGFFVSDHSAFTRIEPRRPAEYMNVQQARNGGNGTSINTRGSTLPPFSIESILRELFNPPRNQ